MEAGQKPASPAHFFAESCYFRAKMCTHSPKKVLQFFPRPPPLFWQKVKNSLPNSPKTVASRGFSAQNPEASAQSGVFDLFAKKSSGLWGHKGTIRKTQKPQKADASRPKKSKKHEVLFPRLSRAKRAEGPFGPKSAPKRPFWPKAKSDLRGQASCLRFLRSKKRKRSDPRDLCRFWPKAKNCKICDFAHLSSKKMTKNGQKNDRSRLVKKTNLSPKTSLPLPFFGQKGFNLFGQKKGEKNPDSPSNSKFPPNSRLSLDFQKESNERW